MPISKSGYMGAKCQECQYEWVIDLNLPMSVNNFTRLLREARCPNCDSDKICVASPKLTK